MGGADVTKLNHPKASSSLAKSFSRDDICEWRASSSWSSDFPSEMAIMARRTQSSNSTRILGRLLPRPIKILNIFNKW